MEKQKKNSMLKNLEEQDLVENDYQIALLLDSEERDKFRKTKSENFESDSYFFLVLPHTQALALLLIIHCMV
jgi:hypothetical protein